MMADDPRTPQRVAACGIYTVAGVVEIRAIAGRVYPAQLLVCGRAWQEPVCSAKIRQRKAAELQGLVAAHTANGGAVSLVTFTAGEHHAADSLESSLALLRRAWERLIHSNRWERLRARCGIIGLGLAYEFTWSPEHGWHPHLHALIFHQAWLDPAGIVDLMQTCRERWALTINAAGRYLHPVHGVDVKPNADGPQLAGYVTKVQEGDWTVAQEVTKGDVKRARRAHGQVPFDMLREHYRTGDLDPWRRYGEYTAAVMLSGRRSLPIFRLTPGLRRQVLGDGGESPALTDEQMALVEVGGLLVCVLAWRVWVRIRQARAVGDLLDAGERGGLAAINDLLAERGLGWADPPPGQGQVRRES